MSSLHQYEAFGFQILDCSYPPQLLNIELALAFLLRYVALSSAGVAWKCVAACTRRNAGNFLILSSSSNHMRKVHASNSLSHSTISSSSNFDGRMLVAIEIP